jgi:hypothetical protein
MGSDGVKDPELVIKSEFEEENNGSSDLQEKGSGGKEDQQDRLHDLQVQQQTKAKKD